MAEQQTLPESFGLNKFADLCHAESKAKGWHSSGDGNPAEVKRIGTMILLVTSELTEAFEEVRNGGPCDAIYHGPDGKPEGFAVEIADAIIRIGDMAAALGLDLDAVVAMKLAFNRTRPRRHGNKAA